ncbi:TonB-dependent receptor [Flavihumibacter sp. R14]|nr:TonB-dependent receptor [Flavihumibacter soli]
MRYFLIVAFTCLTNCLLAQSSTVVNGHVQDEKSLPLGNVTVRLLNTSFSTQTDKDGFFSLNISASKAVISFSRIGYKTVFLEIGIVAGQINRQDVIMFPESRTLEEVRVRGDKDNKTNITGIDAALLQSLPSASGNFESILKTLPGVSSNNELSSQYSVRGGNFDENLVYVNDVEIYRPLLVRNGQQEGLSFINPELASHVKFSAGGFEARYGDKLSSVLDVKYLRADSTVIIASIGLLGNSLTLKLPGKRNYFLGGIRLKDNRSILNTQDIKGAYQPEFSDYQAVYGGDLNKKLSYSLSGNYNFSSFLLEPESRETKFGTFNEVLRLQVDYQGKEADRYETLMGAFSLVYKASSSLNFKWINSAFRVAEQERFDIEGHYIFDEIETDFTNPDFGKVRANRGIGSTLDYARNKLKAGIYSSEIRGYKQIRNSFFESGIRFQFEDLHDRLNEYQVIDSAGYILPVNDGPLQLSNVVNATNDVSTQHLSGFVQNSMQLSPRLSLTAGLRANYSSYTGEFLLSPRFNLAYQPKTQNDLLLRLSAGAYDQQPFYREFRRFDGTLNPDVRAQRSWHFLTGADYNFNGLGTTLRLSSELYYKYLSQLTPYKIENLRIRYFADQQSKGYAAGADFSLSGHFVKDLESSFRLSFMKTAEDITDDSYSEEDEEGNPVTIEPSYLKRPSDQRINFSMFFQDRLLNDPSYKVHLTMLYGAAMPVGPPGTERYRDVFKIPAYKRVDIGFSKDFMDRRNKISSGFLSQYFESLIAYAEIFNLLDINNTVSYIWIKDVNNNQYAVPNYLTSRQFNFRIIAKIKSK